MTPFVSAARTPATLGPVIAPLRRRVPLLARAPRDPRWYQIAVLSGLLGWGLFRLRFDLAAPQVVVTIGAALATQLACTRIARLPKFDPKSALISGLSLCLLLRTDRLGLAALAGVIAVASKFALRVDG